MGLLRRCAPRNDGQNNVRNDALNREALNDGRNMLTSDAPRFTIHHSPLTINHSYLSPRAIFAGT
jgi:hypothetical protein